MKEIKFSPELINDLKKLRKENLKLYQKIQKQLASFQNNPLNNSLRLHKLKGKLKNVWSISIDNDYRMLYIDNDYIYFFDFGTHNQIYKN